MCVLIFRLTIYIGPISKSTYIDRSHFLKIQVTQVYIQAIKNSNKFKRYEKGGVYSDLFLCIYTHKWYLYKHLQLTFLT